jgi:hypothetical protein
VGIWCRRMRWRAELGARGHKVSLITDERGKRIPGLFDDIEVHVMPAGRVAVARSAG